MNLGDDSHRAFLSFFFSSGSFGPFRRPLCWGDRRDCHWLPARSCPHCRGAVFCIKEHYLGVSSPHGLARGSGPLDFAISLPSPRPFCSDHWVWFALFAHSWGSMAGHWCGCLSSSLCPGSESWPFCVSWKHGVSCGSSLLLKPAGANSCCRLKCEEEENRLPHSELFDGKHCILFKLSAGGEARWQRITPACGRPQV